MGFTGHGLNSKHRHPQDGLVCLGGTQDCQRVQPSSCYQHPSTVVTLNCRRVWLDNYVTGKCKTTINALQMDPSTRNQNTNLYHFLPIHLNG